MEYKPLYKRTFSLVFRVAFNAPSFCCGDASGFHPVIMGNVPWIWGTYFSRARVLTILNRPPRNFSKKRGQKRPHGPWDVAGRSYYLRKKQRCVRSPPPSRGGDRQTEGRRILRPQKNLFFSFLLGKRARTALFRSPPVPLLFYCPS